MFLSFFDDNNLCAAERYSKISTVDSITMLIDGRMNGWDQITTYDNYDNCSFGNFYSNLENLTDISLRRLANDTVTLYCQNDVVDGIQVDLEPYQGKYQEPLSRYVGYLAEFMEDANQTSGCRNEKHPMGRTVSYYAFAHDIYKSTTVPHKTFNKLLGPNGYYVFSGYDLDPKSEDGGFAFNTPKEFAQRLRNEIPFIRKVIRKEKKIFSCFANGSIMPRIRAVCTDERQGVRRGMQPNF